MEVKDLVEINTDVLIAALITTVLLVLILIVIQKKMNFPGKLFYISIICALPLSYLINQIKIPILVDLFQSKVLDKTLTLTDGILWVLIVGFTEELIKFIVFLSILHFIKLNKQKNATIVAYCVGIGFGIGEIWWLTSEFIFLNSPSLIGLGWTAWLSGFGFERFFVTFGHAAIFMVVLFGYRKNSLSTLLYLGVAMVLHALYDFPIILSTIGIITSIEMALIVFLELIYGFIVSFYLLDYFARIPVDEGREIKKQELLKRAHDSL